MFHIVLLALRTTNIGFVTCNTRFLYPSLESNSLGWPGQVNWGCFRWINTHNGSLKKMSRLKRVALILTCIIEWDLLAHCVRRRQGDRGATYISTVIHNVLYQWYNARSEARGPSYSETLLVHISLARHPCFATSNNKNCFPLSNWCRFSNIRARSS